MADDTGTAAADAAAQAAADAAAATAKAEADAAAAAAAGGDDDAFDKERAMATIHKLRDAEKAGKQAARDLEAAQARLKEIEDAQKSELELAQQKAADLEAKQASWEQERRETNLKLAVFSKQTELGIADADLALAALDRGAIEYSDDGEPSNLDEQLTALLERKPLLKGAATPPAPPAINGGSGGSGGPPPALTADELAAAKNLGLTPERYALAKSTPTVSELIAARAKGA